MKQKKSLIIYFSKLSIGGMERALIDFIRKSNLCENYDITLYLAYVLEKSYLEEVSKYAKVKVVCKGSWTLLGKIKTYFLMNFDYLRMLFSSKKYDCAICYTHHHKILSKLARVSSDNNIIFVHADLIKSRNQDELNKLKRKVKFDHFKKVVCVSCRAKDAFLKIYPNYQGLVFVANNYINGDYIKEKSKELVDDYDFNKLTFINIARHVEFPKQISFIIEASKRLIDEGYRFNVLLIGDGPDHAMYCDLVEKYHLNDCITLLGSRVNPYKYLSRASAMLFSSSFEGYGIVLDEARVLNKPIITTNVADSKMIVEAGYGILCENSIDGIYNGMKKFIENGYECKHFNYKKFNDNITKTILEIVK